MNIKHQVWMFLGRNRFLYPTFYFLGIKNEGIETTRKACDIVIEGYPRCANTFAYVAFKLMQKEEILNLKVAHHIHGPLQIIRGIELGIPSILLIRNPTDAIISLMIRDDSIRPKDAFKNYIKFHHKLINYISEIVIADFGIITQDFKKIVEAVNKKYNKNYVVIELDEAFLEQCKAEVMEMDKRDTGEENVDKTKVGIPSKERKKLKSELRTRVSAEIDEKLLSSANRLYAQFKEMSIS
jgi:hypothetical protein